MATSAFSRVPWEFNPDMAYMYSGPGKMMAMAMASGPKNHEAMMKDAKKVPNNTVFFMDGGQPATFIGPDPEPKAFAFIGSNEAVPCGRPSQENDTMSEKSIYRVA